MAWTPRVPLVHAEQMVDFEGINTHIIERRLTLEHAIRRPVRLLGESVLLLYLPSQYAAEDVSDRLYLGLGATYRFGFAQARHEMAELRDSRRRPVVAQTVPTRPYNVSAFLRTLVAESVHGLIQTLTQYARTLDDHDPMVHVQMRDRADRLSHNLALEVVGKVLNAGRALAALGRDEPIIAERPPALYAMRSEQLDENTCIPCEGLHGKVVEVGSSDYFVFMPPELCLGRGRCRGIYVYGDSAEDFLP